MLAMASSIAIWTSALNVRELVLQGRPGSCSASRLTLAPSSPILLGYAGLDRYRLAAAHVDREVAAT